MPHRNRLAANPLPEDGSVNIFDAPRNQIQRLVDTFEAFLLKWALRVDNPQ